jgi:hypothetical protein
MYAHYPKRAVVCGLFPQGENFHVHAGGSTVKPDVSAVLLTAASWPVILPQSSRHAGPADLVIAARFLPYVTSATLGEPAPNRHTETGYRPWPHPSIATSASISTGMENGSSAIPTADRA